jgi:hypothetical protein
MRHPYKSDLDPQMAGDCVVCGNRHNHPIHDVPLDSLSDVRDRLREVFGRTPFIGEAERLLSELHQRFSRGARMVRLGEILRGEPTQEAFELLMPALSALSTSSFAVIDLIGVDRAGDPLPPRETYDRVRTGRQAEETWLAVVPRPGFLALRPV